MNSYKKTSGIFLYENNLRFLFSVFLLFLLPVILQAQSVKEQVMLKASDCTMALVEWDIETIIQTSYPKLIELSGGKSEMAKALLNAKSSMESQGYKLASCQVHEPTQFDSTENRTYAVVPITMYMLSPKGALSQNGFLLAISENQNNNWTFIDATNLSSKVLAMVFPDDVNLLQRLNLPEIEKPTLHLKEEE